MAITTTSLDLVDDLFYFPERPLSRRLGDKDTGRVINSKPISCALAMLSGVIKTLISPAIEAIGMVGFFLKGGYHLVRGETNQAKLNFGASLICMAMLAATVAFIYLSACYLDINSAAVIVFAFMAVAVVVHVARASKDTPQKATTAT